MGPSDVTLRAERLGVVITLEGDGGIRLSRMPYTLEVLGYPTACEAGEPDAVRCYSMEVAIHYLILCERRVRESVRPNPARRRDRRLSAL